MERPSFKAWHPFSPIAPVEHVNSVLTYADSNQHPISFMLVKWGRYPLVSLDCCGGLGCMQGLFHGLTACKVYYMRPDGSGSSTAAGASTPAPHPHPPAPARRGATCRQTHHPFLRGWLACLIATALRSVATRNQAVSKCKIPATGSILNRAALFCSVGLSPLQVVSIMIANLGNITGQQSISSKIPQYWLHFQPELHSAASGSSPS
jgi:hypothetical protein